MSTTIDPDVAELDIPPRQSGYGPSDNSDSASDVIGTAAEYSDSDAQGTGERTSVENIKPNRTERDIEPDKVITPAENEEDAEDDSGLLLVDWLSQKNGTA